MPISIKTTTVNDNEVHIEYSWEKYRRADFYGPEEGGIEEIIAVWAECRDNKKEYHSVDIYPFLDEETTDRLWEELHNPPKDDW